MYIHSSTIAIIFIHFNNLTINQCGSFSNKKTLYTLSINASVCVLYNEFSFGYTNKRFNSHDLVNISNSLFVQR